VNAAREHIPAPRRRTAVAQPEDPAEDREFLRQALADAIIYRAAAAAEPCPDCAVHPALLCPPHAAEMDWVSVYREILAARS
jgi:hypothetical protein